ncbi:MAG: tyrosine--tRNA ligase [Actinobacteria bacterium]|nr:tyrosine--tRNA ligase [Actinomycetota bacterium]
MSKILDELKWRGLLHDATDQDNLAAALDIGLTFYVGFDPTAPSMHVGNLVQILTAKRLQQAGNTPLALVGGATGLIGDPKMSGERTLNEADVVRAWSDRIENQLRKFFDFDGPNAAQVINNFDWTHGVGVLEFLRDIGKHFSVNRMLDREAVAARLANQGISFTEFSYQILQAFDYLHLNQNYNAILQTGGSDQWGNLTAGTDLIRRVTGKTVHAFSTPLLTKSDGGKFGKTESGTIWLDAELTSAYAFYQFWLNIDDRDLEKMLKVFSFKDIDEIKNLLTASNKDPHLRIGQRSLAQEMTALVHSVEDLEQVEQASAVLFGSGDFSSLNQKTLESVLAEAGLVEVELLNGELPPVVDLFVAAGVVKSKTEARRMIADGAAWVNNQKLEPETVDITRESLLFGQYLVLRRGRKTIAGIKLLA